MGRGQGKKQRLLRRDFRGENRRDDVWAQDGSGKRGGRQQQGGQQRGGVPFLDLADLHNEAFDEYYKEQGIIPDGEWDAFIGSLRRPLPITFRINGSGRFANELRQKLESDFFANFSEGPIMLDGEVLDPPRPLPWYPGKLGWHLNFSRGQLRKLAWLGDIHEFMKAANEAGTITRQEAVSMVPPLFMDVQPHHKVLDMCAAPGSKTFQLLEMLHDFGDSNSGAAADAAAAAGANAALTPSGFVVANDADAQRCNLLVHQTKRMCSPCLMVTNHEGQMFPRVSRAAAARAAPGSAAAAAAALAGAVPDAAAGAEAPPPPQQQQQQQPGRGGVRDDDVMLFDRILCDVPCSGDGTIRKAPDIWRRWTVNNGNGLHNTQLRIALQAARLLAVGGRMVYSTCTFNPIEDEAVVAELLIRCGGALELLDVSGQLPELRRLPGKRRWRVRDRFRWWDTWEEAQQLGFKLDPTMFSSPEKQQLPLERCMRILPHHQDTGGFFIAVLQKVAPTPKLPEPTLSHRFTRYIHSTGRETRIIKAEGADPGAGAAVAASAALQAAEAAINALEAGDAAGVSAALATTGAAVARAGLAQDAATEAHKHSAKYEVQLAKWQAKLQEREQQQAAKQRQQDAAAAAAQPGAGAADAGGAMEGVEEEAAAAAAAADADADAAEAGAADAELGAAAAEEDEQMQDEPDAADAAAGAGEAAGDGGGAAGGGEGRAPWQPSWARGGGGRGRSGGRFRGIDPILPVEDPHIIQMLVDFYGVEPGFPLSTHLITRSLESTYPKRLYYVSDSLLALLLADEREALKITSTGLKLFERHEVKNKTLGKCMYRIAQEGLPFLLPHLKKQVIRLGVDDFLRVLTEKNLPVPAAAAPAAVAQHSQAQQQAAQQAAQQGQQGQQAGQAPGQPGKPAGSPQAPLDTPAVLQQLAGIELGGAVALLEEQAARQLGLATEEVSGALTANAPLAIAVWRSRASLGVLVTKAECEQLADKIRQAQARQQKLAAAGGGGGDAAAPAASAQPAAEPVAS